MSSYLVDPAHIDVLLSIAIHGPRGVQPGWTPPYIDELLESGQHHGPLSEELASLAGQKLLRRCVTSISHACGKPLGELPGPLPNPVPEQYEWTDFDRVLTAIEGCKALDFYEYQSSEDPGWWSSGANVFCHRLRRALVTQMPGYSEAVSHWTTERALARAHRPVGRPA